MEDNITMSEVCSNVLVSIFRKRRKYLKISLERLAEISEISPIDLFKIESGEEPTTFEFFDKMTRLMNMIEFCKEADNFHEEEKWKSELLN